MNIKIDLHGVKHQEVFNIISEKIESALKSKHPREYVFTVITGHSSKMEELVNITLDAYDIKPITTFLTTDMVFTLGEILPE